MQEIIEKINHIRFYVEGACRATATENLAFEVLDELFHKLEKLKEFVIDEFESNEECKRKYCEITNTESFDEPLPECTLIKKRKE